MIHARGNNFGCGPIQLKDYQDSKVIVLNAKITFDPSNAAYRAATVLEIYVPDLTLKRGTDSFAYISSEKLMWPGHTTETLFKMGTAVKIWLRDKNTICIEKLPLYDDLSEVTIWIGSIFTMLGEGGTPSKFTKTTVYYRAVSQSISASDIACVVQPGWCFLHFDYSNMMGFRSNLPITANIENFPTDIDCEVPIIGGDQQTNYDGCLISEARISNGVFNAQNVLSYIANSGNNPFVCYYFVRDV